MDDMRAFYEALNAVHGPSYQIQASPCSSDERTLLTDKTAIIQRSSGHFESLFSDQRTVQESSQAKFPQANVKLELDDPPTCEEIEKATVQLKVGKSLGTDVIPAEVIITGEMQCSISPRICSPIVGRKGLYRRT